MAAPKKWAAADGERIVQVETPSTLRARDLVDIYQSLGNSSRYVVAGFTYS